MFHKGQTFTCSVPVREVTIDVNHYYVSVCRDRLRVVTNTMGTITGAVFTNTLCKNSLEKDTVNVKEQADVEITHTENIDTRM